jgi:phospholipase A-2-activating protein
MPKSAPYELAFQLHGHASDVRSLCAPSPDVPLLLSGSRDGSALLWGPGRGKEWDVKLRVEAPEKKYVSCVGLTKWQGEGMLL